jgi:hypothetical protein
MSLYKPNRSSIWWYEFRFEGKRIRETTKTASRTLAVAAERARRRQLEESFNGIHPKRLPKRFSEASDEYLNAKTGNVAPSTLAIETFNVRRLNSFLRSKLISEITASDFKAFQILRLGEGRRPRTVNIELQTLRAILRRNELWDPTSNLW